MGAVEGDYTGDTKWVVVARELVCTMLEEVRVGGDHVGDDVGVWFHECVEGLGRAIERHCQTYEESRREGFSCKEFTKEGQEDRLRRGGREGWR